MPTILWPCVRAYATANTAHSIPNENHSDLKRTSSWFQNHTENSQLSPTGDYSVYFMEDFLSNKNSSDEIIGQSPVGNIVNFAYKICRHRLYTGCKGCKIIGVCGFRHKRRTRAFSVYEECAQLINFTPSFLVLQGWIQDFHLVGAQKIMMRGCFIHIFVTCTARNRKL